MQNNFMCSKLLIFNYFNDPEVVGSNPTGSKKLIFQILFIFKNCNEILILK